VSPGRARDAALTLALLLGFAGAVGMAGVLDAGRTTLRSLQPRSAS